jgi:hypothetical protein
MLVSTLLCGGIMARDARAGVTYTTVPGKTNDGPLQATITFTALDGGIMATVTNTESGINFRQGQAVSAFSFTIVSPLVPTAYSGIAGDYLTPVSGAAWPTSSTPITEYGYDASPAAGSDVGWGATVGKTTSTGAAGNASPGGLPTYLIIPSTGTAGSGKSLTGHGPYFIGPTEFFFAVPNVMATTNLVSADFSNVKIGFGTAPDLTLGTTLTDSGSSIQAQALIAPAQAGAVPEPSSLALAIAGFGAIGFLGYRRRRRLTK